MKFPKINLGRIKTKHLTTGMILSVSALGLLFYTFNIPLSDLTSLSFYENLANPSMRMVNIPEGLRKEEIANTLANDLGWNDFEKTTFLNAHIALGKQNLEGYYFPKSYLVDKNTSPLDMTHIMVDEFNKQTKSIKKTKKTQILNEDTVLKVASIIQREAAGHGDMKLISGIIWNRIFKGMKLQLDATLQYAKGDEDSWWPTVSPEDKKIDSPYNTYLYKDLPPSPIDNPGLVAIQAAYNPQPTSCLFFLHDKRGGIHCTTTYEAHKANIERYY
jgi:UPF0755 protein